MGAKFHHYTPKFYLQAFADPKNPKTILVYEKGAKQTPRPLGINGVAGETYYYAIETPSGGKDDSFEQQFLSRIEGDAAPVLRRLIADDDPSLNSVDIQALAPFLSVFYCRSPQFRRTIQETFSVLARQQLKELQANPSLLDEFIAANPELASQRAELEQALEIGQDPEKMTLSMRMNYLLFTTFMLFHKFVPYFQARRWNLLSSPEQVDLITSDSPLSVFKLDRDGQALVGAGLGLRDSEITLPISPRLAIRLSSTESVARRTISAWQARDLNRRIIAQAERYVYAPRASKTISSAVVEFAYTRNKPRINPDAFESRT